MFRPELQAELDSCQMAHRSSASLGVVIDRIIALRQLLNRSSRPGIGLGTLVLVDSLLKDLQVGARIWTMTPSSIDYGSVADVYDLYVTSDYDFPFFLQETAGVAGPVLELAAGTGRLSLPLIKSGAQLTCVDISRSMLDVLSRKLRSQDLHAETLHADVCELDLEPVFELAILPFQAFLEIVGSSRQRTALAAVFACLAPGGRFVCTLHNPAIRRLQVDGALRVVGHFPAPGGTLVVSGFEQGGRPVVTRLQFFEFFSNDGTLQSKRLLPMEFELIEKDTFESMALDAGFRVQELYGTYDRSPFDASSSPVMIWVLEK